MSLRPNWTDVRFDHAGASALADELTALAREVRGYAGDREQAVHHLTGTAHRRGSFSGEHATRWAMRMQHDAGLAPVIAGNLEAAADQLHTASDLARQEQERREHVRRLWHEEQARRREQRND